MSKQLQILVVREDLDQFLAFAEDRGFRALPVVVESDAIPEAQPPTTAKFDGDCDFFYLLPKGFAVVEAFYVNLPFEHGLSKLAAGTSPVIEVTPAKATRNRPVEGRIYVDWDSQDPRAGKTLKAYQELAQFLQKWRKSSDGSYVGPHAETILKSKPNRSR